MRPYAGLTDEQLEAEIQAYLAARREVALGGGVGVIAGEGRRIEYVRSNIGLLDQDLRALGWEARYRGLAIGGDGGAIAVEFGR